MNNRLKLMGIILLTLIGEPCLILSYIMYDVNGLFVISSCIVYLVVFSIGLSFWFDKQRKSKSEKGVFVGTMALLLVFFFLSCYVYWFIHTMDHARENKELKNESSESRN